MSDKRILPAFLLCFFVGVFGAHRFYVGKTGTGIIQILTLGGFGIWAFADFIMIIVGAFTDKEGNKITQWT
jgi:TM2 domain-containing membrane protein YozV